MSDVIVCQVPVSEKCPSGTKIVVPSPKASMRTVLEKDLPKDTINHFICHRDEVPQDRYFRNAWECDSAAKKVAPNMPKARELHINNLREKRNKKLQDLDAEYMKADEMGDATKKTQVKAMKDQLRDMPQDPMFASAQTPEALKACMPEYLK